MIESIKVKGLLSFGWEDSEFQLKPLNVLIGPNGSGKSNLIEVIKILQSIPSGELVPFRKGGANEWIHKQGGSEKVAEIEVVVSVPKQNFPLRYKIAFRSQDPHMVVEEEMLESTEIKPDEDGFYSFFKVRQGNGVINTKTKGERRLIREFFNPQKSVLSQREDPDEFFEIYSTSEIFKKIHVYQDWIFGGSNPLRSSSETSSQNQYLQPDFKNFGMVLNYFRKDVPTKKRILKYLREVYDGVQDFDISVESDSVRVFLQEDDFIFPAVRLSDGTLRWLCLLVILLNPKPPPLICIEEPELGLHPDMMDVLADLLKEASKKTCLIVTTHSEVLVDALSDTPESVVVVEKENGATILRRQDSEYLAELLKNGNSLGDMWRGGEIGGNRR